MVNSEYGKMDLCSLLSSKMSQKLSSKSLNVVTPLVLPVFKILPEKSD